MIDAMHIHPLTDFLRNYKSYVARLHETRTPEMLTVRGLPSVVMLDADTYENLVTRLQRMEEIASIRADFARERKAGLVEDPITEEEIARRTRVMHELVAETERLGLYH